MKHVAAALISALLLVLVPTASQATNKPDVPTVAAKAGAKEVRTLKRLTCRKIPTCDKGESYWQGSDKGRIKGEDGAGVFVFKQIRKCGKGKWTNLTRETTTARGVFDFYFTYKASERKKYKVREYNPKFPNSVQFSFFIPGTDEYKAFRVTDSSCFG